MLLVEDNPLDATLVEEAVKESFGTVDIVIISDGEEAIKQVSSGDVEPDFILLDLNLPKKSGLEVLGELKRDPLLRAIPVIIMTNSKAEEDVLAAYNAYCNAYVRKPLGFEKLAGTMNKLIQFWASCASLPDVRLPNMSMPPILDE